MQNIPDRFQLDAIAWAAQQRHQSVVDALVRWRTDVLRVSAEQILHLRQYLHLQLGRVRVFGALFYERVQHDRYVADHVFVRAHEGG